MIVIDTAHGHTQGVVDAVRTIKKGWPDLPVVGGNVVTREGVETLVEAGADVIKVGVGAGSICTTRIVAGAGMPQMTAIHECVQAARELGVPIIADGGIVTSGDIVKAFVAGRRRRHARQPARRCRRGAGRARARRRGDVEDLPGHGLLGCDAERRASDRYGTGQAPGKHVAEGVEGRVRYAGPMSNSSARSSVAFGRAWATPVPPTSTTYAIAPGSPASPVPVCLRESHPHDITVLRDE